MTPQLLEFFVGGRHQLGALILYRGETFMETVEEGGFAIFVFVSGNATISRTREGKQVGLHLNPAMGRPLIFRQPGTYCVVAKDHTIGCRLLRTGAT